MSTDEGMVSFLFDVPVPAQAHALVFQDLVFQQCVEDADRHGPGPGPRNPHPRPRPLPGRQRGRNTDNTDIILPKWIFIKDKDDRYLRSSQVPLKSQLTFHAGSPDLNNIFQAVKTGNSTYKLIDHFNHYFCRLFYKNNIKPPFYGANMNKSNPPFRIIASSGDKVYLKDDYSPSCFFSNDLNEYDAPIAHDYVNESSEMQIMQASIKNEIVNIEYDIPDGKVHDVVPLIALSTSVRNDSDGDVQQTLSYAYEKWTVGTWNNSAGVEIGVKSTFKAGVPFVASADFEISISGSYSHEWGGEEGKKETITSSTTVTVPPKKKARATIIVRNANIDVSFTYTQRIFWSNGESEDEQRSGVYNNVDSWHVDVVLDNWEPV